METAGAILSTINIFNFSHCHHQIQRAAGRHSKFEALRLLEGAVHFFAVLNDADLMTS